MLRSMTGYGKAEVSVSGKKIIIEIKSLNSKNFDNNIKLPLTLREKELEIRQTLSEKLIRGKIDCNVYYEGNDNSNTVVVNKEAIKIYYRELQSLAGELKIETGESLLRAILRLPEAIKTERSEIDPQEWESVATGINEALEKLEKFRLQEGKAMEDDMEARISNILKFLGEIEKYENKRVDKVRERILRSLKELNLQDEIDRNRFEQELIYYIEKLDISEEKTRLSNHCRYFTETMGSKEAAGKKLSFISQEIGREINTIGSKANDGDIQHLVVKMKDELEKIKEQILNIL